MRSAPGGGPVPARSTIGLDMPHGTGLESMIQWLSNQKSVYVARSRIACLMSGSAARGRLFQSGCFDT